MIPLSKQLTFLDYLFDIYNVLNEDQEITGDTVTQIGIEYSNYNSMQIIAKELQVDFQTLLNYVYMLYVNEYKINNSKKKYK